MNWRRPYKHIGLFLLVSLICIVLFSGFQILVVSYLYPKEISLPIYKQFTLTTPFPVTLHVKGRVNSDSQKAVILSNKTFLGLTKSISVQSEKLTNINLELRLFGMIPFRALSLHILNQVRVIPGGQSIGVLLSKEGVIVVGMVALRNFKGTEYFPGQDAGLEIGDIIVKVNDYPINNTQEMPLIVNRLGDINKQLSLTIRRHGEMIVKKITPLLEKSAPKKEYKLGLYIQDPAAGVGTLTYYDPGKKYYGALGHVIRELNKKSYLLGKESSIIGADIVGIESGNRGEPGEKIGVFQSSAKVLGNIAKNTQFGIFGKLEEIPEEWEAREAIPVAFAYEVHEGPAEILTVLEGHLVEKYEVRIIKVNRQYLPQIKSMVIKITDPRLLAKTGGIIQGMSGSPIIQDNQLIGAITHVFINDPTKGYGVFAEWMLREMLEDQAGEQKIAS